MRRADTAFVSAIPTLVVAHINGSAPQTGLNINLHKLLYKLYLSRMLYK